LLLTLTPLRQNSLRLSTLGLYELRDLLLIIDRRDRWTIQSRNLLLSRDHTFGQCICIINYTFWPFFYTFVTFYFLKTVLILICLELWKEYETLYLFKPIQAYDSKLDWRAMLPYIRCKVLIQYNYLRSSL